MLTRFKETELRLRLRKAGYLLRKMRAGSKAHDILGPGFMVVDMNANAVVLGARHWAYGASLDEVAEFAAAYT